MYSAFVKLLNMSAVAGILIAVVIVLRLVFRKTPKKYICVLWAFVALRLICPVSISSAMSAFNYIGSQTSDSGQVSYVQYNGKSEKPQAEFMVQLPAASGPEDGPTAIYMTAAVYLPTIMYFWAAGAAVLMTCGFLSYYQVWLGVRESLHLRRNIYLCDRIPSPFILGVLQPKIYLPSHLDAEQQRSVISHEDAHIARLDHLWKPIGYLLLSIHWFNPLVWIAYGLLCRDIEMACDEKVIQNMTPAEKQAYSTVLLTCSMPRQFITACPLAFGEVGVKERVRGILNYRKPTFWVILFAVMVCAAVAVFFLTNPAMAISETTIGISDYLAMLYQQTDVLFVPEEESIMMKFGLVLIGVALLNLLLAVFSDGRHWLNYRLFSGKTTAKVHEIRPFTINDSRSAVEQLQPDGTWKHLLESEDRAVQLRPYGFLLFDEKKPMTRFQWEAEGSQWRGNYRYLYRNPVWQVGDAVELHYSPAKPWLFEVADTRIAKTILLKVAVSILLILAGVLTMSFADRDVVRNETAENRLYARERMREAYNSRYQPELTTITVEHGEDYDIVWEDAGMEAHIRFLLDKPEGSIRHSDVWNIQKLELNATTGKDGKISTGDFAYENTEREEPSFGGGYFGKAFPDVRTLGDLRHFDSLQSFDFSLASAKPPITSLSGLEACRNLRILHLSNLQDISLEPLSGLPNLEVLWLSECERLDIAPLGKVNSLRELRLGAKEIVSLEPLAQLPVLDYLSFSGVVPSYEPLSGTTIRFLRLESPRNSGYDFGPLTRIPNLMYLDVSDNSSMDTDLCTAIIAGNPNLRYLDISFTPAAKRSGDLPDETLLAVVDIMR